MPSKQTGPSKLYADLMEEAKARFGCIDAAVSGKTGLPAPAVREFCFLQLRLLCELIALGCLVAHGDITERNGNKLQKQYAADEIMKALARLHANFYPRPARITVTPACSEFPKGNVHLDWKSADEFLTKDELLTLYGKCGDTLHRGTVKKLLSEKQPIVIDFPEIVAWTNKIVALLDGHWISSPDNKSHLLVVLSNKDDGGRVQVAFAESP